MYILQEIIYLTIMVEKITNLKYHSDSIDYAHNIDQALNK